MVEAYVEKNPMTDADAREHTMSLSKCGAESKTVLSRRGGVSYSSVIPSDHVRTIDCREGVQKELCPAGEACGEPGGPVEDEHGGEPGGERRSTFEGGDAGSPAVALDVPEKVGRRRW